MMCRNQSSRWAETKALLVVPMVAVALSAFATTEYVPREVQDKITENSANLQAEEKAQPLVVVDGKVVAYDEMTNLNPSTIDNMSVFKGDKAKEYAAELGLNISAEDVKDGLIVITLKKDGQTDVSAEAIRGKIANIVIADKQDKGQSSKTQNSTITILGNSDATKMTTVQMGQKDGEKPTIIINGEEIPYTSLNDIHSDKVESMDVHKLDDGTSIVYIALKPNTTTDEALKSNADLVHLSGKVVDKEGKPLVGVIVLVEGTKRGAVTDGAGQFSIYASQDETLTFSYINMKTESVKVKSVKSPIVVTLKQE